jgi:Cu+-exporting ATPase
MAVDPAKSPHRAEFDGKKYYFCSDGCRGKFVGEPARYLEPAAKPPFAAVPKETIYTCPMHPEIRQIGPGACSALAMC